jgi:hypothetical protein
MIRLRDLHLKWLDDERHRRAVLIGLLVVAFVLRLTAALTIPLDYRFRDDAVEYISGAQHLWTLGVDRVIATGYKWCRDHEMAVTVVMAGNGLETCTA